MKRQAGYTLVEMLLVLSVLVVVLAATLSLLDKTSETLPADQERAHAVREAQVGVARVTRDVRQAHAVHAPAPGVAAQLLDVEVELNGVDRRVTIDCRPASQSEPGTRACVRSSRPVAGGPAKVDVVVDRVTNADVFTRTGARTLRVRVEVPAKGTRDDARGHRIVLDDGVFMRNVADG